MKVQDLVIKYLDEARMMQLATSAGEQPWCCTLYFAHDNLHNIYWISTSERRHSREIAANPHVAAVIVLPHKPGEPGRGVQLQGLARILTDHNEVNEHIVAYSARYNRPDLAMSILSGKNPHSLYQIKPELFVLYDEVNFPDNPRQEWKIAT